MNEDRITKYWSNFFGIKNEEMISKGISLVPHKLLKGYNGVWIFQRKNRIIFSVRKKDLQNLKLKLKDSPPNKNVIFSTSYINHLFKPNVEKIIGPTFQGYYDSNRISNKTSTNVKQIRIEDYEKEITELSNTGDTNGWKNSGLNRENECIYGYFNKDSILSLANYKIVDGDVGFIGVYTNPEFRGKGYGQEVVRKIVLDLT